MHGRAERRHRRQPRAHARASARARSRGSTATSLVQSGVTHVILLEGINDFGLGGPGGLGGAPLPSAAEVIAGLRQLIERAHAHGLKVIGGTLLPFEGTNLAHLPAYYSTDKDARRQAVNEWIRTGKAYDGIVDFDMALRDPAHPSQLLPPVQGRGQPAPERRGLPGHGQCRQPCAPATMTRA